MLQMVALDPPFRIVLEREKHLSLDAYLAFCRDNPNLRVERTAEGEIVAMPPVGGESSNRNLKLTVQLGTWSDADGRGEAFDSNAQFVLPDGSALSPDASWVSSKALAKLSAGQRRGFPRLAPEFVVEVMSPSDRLKAAGEKMERWVANGVQLGWFIDGDAQVIYVYRKGQPVKIKRGIQQLAGEGPVEGFVLQLKSIWKGRR
jgi:Uma2 family endonuclease